MKRVLRILEIIVCAVMILWDIAEFLAIPALLTVIGLLNAFPWQYYAVSIGIYLGLFLVIELLAWLIAKIFSRTFTSFFRRKRSAIQNRFTSMNKND